MTSFYLFYIPALLFGRIRPPSKPLFFSGAGEKPSGFYTYL